MPHVSSRRRLATIAVATVAAIAAPASSAMAADASATGCPDAPLVNPFAAWGDVADYQLAPGGDVEDAGAGWSLRGGAGAVEGNESYMVNRASDHLSMRLPGASSATTARMCIGAEHPSFRFFAKRTGGSAAARLAVDVVYNDASGAVQSVPAGEIGASEDWAPSPSLPTVVNALAAEQGNAIGVSFRFSPHGGGVWSVDDVFVDPSRGIK